VVSLGIFSVAPTDRTMCPGVDSASENERRPVRMADDLPPL